MYYDWVECNVTSQLPKNAVWICKDVDGSDVYFGKCAMENSILGVKIVEQRRQAYVPYNGKEVPVVNFKILVNHENEYQIWQRASNGVVPENAIICGSDKNGTKLYVGKAYHQGICVPGYINPNDGCIHISYHSKEHCYVQYEVLINQVA